MLAEYDGEGSLVCEYVHGAQVDEMLMKRIPQGADQGMNTYYHQDGLGSTVRLSSADGEILEQYAYDAFGTPQPLDAQGNALSENAESTPQVRHLFTGREYLPEVNLYNYRNRHYDADLGRFLQPDPIGFAAGDVNIYRYVGNNAPNKMDPTGLIDPDQRDPRNRDNEGFHDDNRLRNANPEEMLSDPYPSCLSEGWYRHCVSSCIVQHAVGIGGITQTIAQAYGGDLPGDDRRDQGDIDANQAGIDAANANPSGSISCKSTCRRKYDEEVDSLCCPNDKTKKKP